MPLTITQGFDAFHTKLVPSGSASGRASSHKSSITSRLEADFDLKELFYSGSANNGTSVAGHSDVDFFARIPTGKLKADSSVSLREIKESLQARFWSTDVFVDSPAVVLQFGAGDWDRAEVIPADYRYDKDGYRVYQIPDGSGGWMESSPATHNAYVREENERLGEKLKRLIRFVKAWKYYKSVPVSSFYMELRLAKWMEEESSIVYDIDLCTVFKKLDDCGLAPMRDPRGVSGLIDACSTGAKKSDALSKLGRARSRAEKAREAELSGRTREAFDWWDKLFDGRFPSYYS